MTLAWVVGSTGLLGSALCRELRRRGTSLFSPSERLHWGREPELASQVALAVQAFAGRVGGVERWEIYWAAGVGTMSSSTSDLAPETRTLALLLRLIQSTPMLMALPGALAFSSSAGAIYAGSRDEIISEITPHAPNSAYAHEKLKQEDLLRSFALECNHLTVLLARISTIYGPGQSLGKQQGLLAHIARCIVRNRPIQIYVPFDTIRDYIAVDDAAATMVEALRANADRPRVVTRIIASEHPTTIAEIISIFKRITRRTPRIVTSASRSSNLYSRRVQFQSVATPECAPRSRTSLLIGIAQVLAAERAAFVRGPD